MNLKIITKSQLGLTTRLSFVSSLLISLSMVYVALNHNPQGEFYSSEGIIEWSNLIILFLSWFVSVWLALFSLGIIVVLIKNHSWRVNKK